MQKVHKNSQAAKKGAAHAKREHEKSYEIQGGGPEVAVMVENFNNNNSGEFGADS